MRAADLHTCLGHLEDVAQIKMIKIMDCLYWQNLLEKPSATATHYSHLGRCDSNSLGHLGQHDKKYKQSYLYLAAQGSQGKYCFVLLSLVLSLVLHQWKHAFTKTIMNCLHWQRLLVKLSATATRDRKIDMILSVSCHTSEYWMLLSLVLLCQCKYSLRKAILPTDFANVHEPKWQRD